MHQHHRLHRRHADREDGQRRTGRTPRLTLVVGGARSGKSGYAQSLVSGQPAIYVATATREGDREMRERIRKHRSDRPHQWITLEEPLNVPAAVRRASPADAPVIVDCVTLWLSNLFERESRTPARKQQALLLAAVHELAVVARDRDVIAVSNEVGGGIVPTTRVGRRSRDLQGWTNQLLAREAGRVVLVVAGLPITLKE